MKLCTKCKVEKPPEDFYKSKSRPSPRMPCKVCFVENTTAYKKTKDLKEYLRIAAAKWRSSHPGYYANQYAILKARHPETLRTNWARKRANRRNAVPKWLTVEHKRQIKEFYKNCPQGYHVDHIVPIAGKNVTGFHVPWNLQYLTAEENIKKGNRV
jgi:hypothetical protein